MKLMVVAGYAARRPTFDEPMDGLVYGAVASLGFAALENILYVSEGGLTVAALRAVTAVPAHACFGAVMGYCVARGKLEPALRSDHLLRATALPVLLHTMYDTPLMILPRLDEHAYVEALGLVAVFVGVLTGVFRHVWRLVRQLRNEQDAAAVGGPALPYAVPSSEG